MTPNRYCIIRAVAHPYSAHMFAAWKRGCGFTGCLPRMEALAFGDVFDSLDDAMAVAPQEAGVRIVNQSSNFTREWDGRCWV